MDGHQLDRGGRVAQPGEARDDLVPGGEESVEADEGRRPSRAARRWRRDRRRPARRRRRRDASRAWRGAGGATGTADRRRGRRRAASRRARTGSASSGVGSVVACGCPARSSASATGVSSARVRARMQQPPPLAASAAASGRQPIGPVMPDRRHHHDRGRAPSRRPGVASIRFSKRSRVRGDQPARGGDDRRRASVVRRQLDAPRVRVELGEAEDPAHVGQAPGVDRLVVVADHEQVPLRLGQDAHHAAAGPRPRPGTRRPPRG